jgi:hypothetical protein
MSVFGGDNLVAVLAAGGWASAQEAQQRTEVMVFAPLSGGQGSGYK